MKKGKKLKGQFFLIAGILLTIMFFTGMPKPDILVQTPTVEDIKYIYENIEREMPRALTLGLNQSAQIETLRNFTAFIDNILKERHITFESLWVTSEGNTSIMINISVGNFLGSSTNVTLNMTDDSGTSVIEYLEPADGATGSVEFHSVTSDFNLTIAYNDELKTVEWERDKVNLYALVNITREENSKKEEFDF